MKKILTLIFVIALLLLLVSCGGEYTVSFTVDGVTVHEVTVKKGETVTPPKAPEKEGYTFFGWTADGVDFDLSTPIKSDITLSAKLIDNATVAWGDGLAFTLSEDGTHYAVSGIGGYKTEDVVIPDTYGNLPVTEISERAFSGNDKIVSVSIPATVTAIGDRAFSGCTALTSFTVDAANTAYAVKNQDLYSLDGTVLVQHTVGRGETSLSIEEGVTKLGAGALSHSKLTSLSLPSTLAELGAYSCYSASALTTVSFPEGSSLKLIGEGAFSSCSALTEFTVPKSVEKLGSFAFYSCKSLTKVLFESGSALSEVEEYIFELCTSLTELHYDGSREKWDMLVTASENNEHLNSLKFAGIGCYTAPSGAWVPTEDYVGITFAAWASEADYLEGQAPVKWYTDLEITREKFGAIDDNGTSYSDAEFIPGYIQLYANIDATDKQQLIVGDTQKLVLNLGGYTLTSKKGFRVGGSYGYHPEASLIIKCGTFDLIQGQIQPRFSSTLIFEDTVFFTGAADIMYGVQSKLLSFVRSEVIVKNGADFRLSTNFNATPLEMTISFVDSDLIYTTSTATSVFEIYEATVGNAKWNISFDKDSAVIGKVTSYIAICQSLQKVDEETSEIIPFPETQKISYSQSTRFLLGASAPSGYTLHPIDVETGNPIPPVIHDGSDALVNITVTE